MGQCLQANCKLISWHLENLIFTRIPKLSLFEAKLTFVLEVVGTWGILLMPIASNWYENL
ncbi:translocon-associated protein subunit alpha-like [Gossypium australe]|uniref:Translocon-associated protein subunit alpha-like n=1 Tax=Gossypium australe TaxID=47621 RepID=A0A5B6WLY1_9ROSI|nr:translocon-associated protein subunit alpha-like [Gossypium australe]